ncbi:coagulation factor IIIa [Synchiropus splendidus]|uniref:coagulation factor IIIa n=1 Tax=Synchiropus splendidus TaxID=270530 RepID=UPI00237D99CE|nr:coagulation factor IIIa [Synchiropus splendidus]
MKASAAAVACVCLCVLLTHGASGFYPKAQNVTWNSINFKTLLTWGPPPSGYSYTVEYYEVNKNKQRLPTCFQTVNTACDLSMSLTNLKSCYIAEVVSQQPLGMTSDLIEFPYTRSEPFCPYTDTKLGRPEVTVEVSEDRKKTTLYVSDPLSAVFQGQQQLNLRDIFAEELQYKVTYRRNKSTGKKVKTSPGNVIKFTDLEKKDSYCFNVQVLIPSRDWDKQLGEMSQTHCTKAHDPPFTTVYSVGVIAAGFFLILLIIGLTIALVVICCKRRRNAQKSGKEGLPLRDV